MFARPFIDSLDFARRNGELRGEVPVAELPRLHDMLSSQEGIISYVLRGMQGKDGSPQLELLLDGCRGTRHHDLHRVDARRSNAGSCRRSG